MEFSSNLKIKTININKIENINKQAMVKGMFK
jgi:hypothetical protein